MEGDGTVGCRVFRSSRPTRPEPFPGRLRGALARLIAALLVGVALAAPPEVAGAQAGMGAAARAGYEERAASDAELRRRAGAEQRRRLARAHARMPSTMYASTPDVAPPPHAVPVEGSETRGPAQSGDTGREHRVALFPAAARTTQGVVGVANRSEEAGEVRIAAWDDDGVPHGPLSLPLGAGESAHFDSGDLEAGNAAKGLEGATGPGAGDWRLVLTSALALEVEAYLRTGDGVLSRLSERVAQSATGQRVVLLRPGRDGAAVSWLRLINANPQGAAVRIEGRDDEGHTVGEPVRLWLAPEAARTLSLRELESGNAPGLSGALGAGTGHLVVSADRSIEAMTLRSGLSALPAVAGKAGQEAEETAQAVFGAHLSGPVVQSKCVVCHVEGGVSGHTRLVFAPAATAGHEASNLRAFEDFDPASESDTMESEGADEESP